MSFRADKGIYPATAPATCQEDYSGDLKPKATNNKDPINPPPKKLPFSWPDLNPNKQRSLPNKQNQPPGPANPATDPEQSKKRPNSPHPWEFCNKCWDFGAHHSDSCDKPSEPCPANFKTELNAIRKLHQTAYIYYKRQRNKK
jgi:hypothetical protein